MKIINQLSEKHISQLHKLYQSEWWTKGRTLEETTQCVNGSQVCVCLIDESGDLIAFARVITDFIFKALIFDVIVAASCRGVGAGDQIMLAIKNHIDLVSIKHFELYCLPELESFYSKIGFTSEVGGIKLMRCVNA